MQRSFLRLTVTPSLLKLCAAEVCTNLEALDLLRSLARHPKVGFLEEPADGETRCHQLASAPSAPPKVWIDAYLAAFAIGHKLERVTPDGDFERFVKEGLKVTIQKFQACNGKDSQDHMGRFFLGRVQTSLSYCKNCIHYEEL